MDEDSIDRAVNGCDFIVHSASATGLYKTEVEVIEPSVCGAKFIIKSAAKHKVKRVVITSSVTSAAFSEIKKDRIDETLWTDIENTFLSADIRSKLLAERLIWDF